MNIIKLKLIDAWSVITLSKLNISNDINIMLDEGKVPHELREDVSVVVAQRIIEKLGDSDGL